MTRSEEAHRREDPTRPGGAIAVTVLTTVAAVLLALASGSASSETRWGQNALSQIHQLNLCPRPEASLTVGIASCRFAKGTIELATSISAPAQRAQLRQLASSEPQDCLLIGTGFILEAPSVPLAIEATGGDLPGFLDRSNSYLSGAC
jgi:hypothetical protein